MASLNPTQYGRYGHPIPLGADQESTSTPPVPPSEEERRGYFHGLPSSPLLVARSSAAAWSRLNYSGFPEEKKMAVATGHAIQQPWNEPNSPLQGSIMKALENLNWTAIDILRIRSNKHLTGEKVGQVMMLITVPENSTTFNQGAADYKYRFNFTEYIGTNIAALDNRQKEGTKGLYLRDSQDSTTTYALTCRHVAYNKEQPADNSRVRQEPPEITQPGQITFDDMQSSFQSEDKELFRVIHSSHGGNVQNETYLEQQQLNKIKFTKLQAYKPLFEDQRADQKFSAFGQVDFSPPFRVSEGRLMDWALVKLAQDKHTTELSQLGNKLPVTGLFGEILESKGVYDTIGFQLNSEVTIGPDVMSLKDLEAEIQAGDSPRGLIGMMHGGKSGFSIGSINGIRSVVRESIDGVLFTSQEWCTIGLDGSAVSKCGDSGSVIFDIHGRVMLLLTSGVRRNDSNTTEVDTAYGTPLVSVLHDMRSYGYELDLAC
ncbi:unnamed protein product [Fusarium fujikuroi]|uniref:Uncharacterized protein n=1 Tax=Fusarium fujikuroi TaxID=5127 RepID=A0A9Q9RXV6_FUSFU|nr:unnamed protein product [Fusarium fujikuroi]